jgi:hypothetical protein
MVKKWPCSICEKSKKKLEKWKVRLNENSIWIYFSKVLTRVNSCSRLSIVSVTLLCLTISTYYFTYFYDIEILCEKQRYFHCVLLGKEDYCINVYMILMLILAMANTARVSFRWWLCVSLPLSVWLLNFYWIFSMKFYIVLH